MNKNDLPNSAAGRAFLKEMDGKGRMYGAGAYGNAWGWFEFGWDATARDLGTSKLVHGEGCAITLVWRAMPLWKACEFAASNKPAESLGACTCHLTALIEAVKGRLGNVSTRENGDDCYQCAGECCEQTDTVRAELAAAKKEADKEIQRLRDALSGASADRRVKEKRIDHLENVVENGLRIEKGFRFARDEALKELAAVKKEIEDTHDLKLWFDKNQTITSYKKDLKSAMDTLEYIRKHADRQVVSEWARNTLARIKKGC